MPYGNILALYITNRGKKPVTILEVGIKLSDLQKKYYTNGIRKLLKKFGPTNRIVADMMLYFPAFDELESPKLPLKLSEGESVIFKFEFDLDNVFIKNTIMCSYARDATGKEFTTRDIYGYNGKFHGL